MQARKRRSQIEVRFQQNYGALVLMHFSLTDITVLLPTRGTSPWFQEALHSALDSDPHVKILILADGATVSMDQEFQGDERVRLVKLEKQKNLASLLNIGVRLADTALIARLDDDDICVKGRFSRQLEVMNSTHAAACSGAAEFIDESGQTLGYSKSNGWRSAPGTDSPLLIRNSIFHPASIFTKEAHGLVGGYSEALNFMEDYDFWLRIARFGLIVVTADVEVRYRIHANQMTKAAPPIGTHITNIVLNRVRLAKQTGSPWMILKAILASGLWWLNQVRRYAKKWTGKIAIKR